MIIKIATGKDSNGNVQWTQLYSRSIRNRLRRDLNLSDLSDVAAARRNLGIENDLDGKLSGMSNTLKQYIDAQDLSYYNKVMDYIRNNIETRLDGIEAQLDEIQNYLTSQIPQQVKTQLDLETERAIVDAIETVRKQLNQRITNMVDDINDNFTTINEIVNRPNHSVTQADLANVVSAINSLSTAFSTRIGTVESGLSAANSNIQTLQSAAYNLSLQNSRQTQWIGSAVTAMNGNFTTLSTIFNNLNYTYHAQALYHLATGT